MSTPVIYVAGPYRGPHEFAVRRNIRWAEDATLELLRRGWIVLCPHKNTEGLGGALPDEAFLRNGLGLLARCDAVLLLAGWEGSAGTRGEYQAAVRLGLKVYFQRDGYPEAPK